MIMEPCVALNKRNICIYLIVYINLYSFTDLSRGSARRGCVVIFFFFPHVCMILLLFHRECCQNKTLALNMGWTIAFSIRGRVCNLPAGFGGDPAPQSSLPSGLSSDGTDGRRGGKCILDIIIKMHCQSGSLAQCCLCLPKHTGGAPPLPGSESVRWCCNSLSNTPRCWTWCISWSRQFYLENVALICSLHVNRLIW